MNEKEKMKKEDMKTVPIKGKPYVMVDQRLLYFDDHYPNGSIITEVKPSPTDRYIVKATVIPDVKNSERRFTGLSEEVVGSNQINDNSALENCETSAVGRALGKMAIGILENLPSAEEMANAIYQQNRQASKSENKPVIAVDGLTCPNCDGKVYDNKGMDGQPRKSFKYDEKIARGETAGLYQPVYKCFDEKCGGSIWEEPVEEEISFYEEAPHQKEPVVEEKMPF